MVVQLRTDEIEKKARDAAGLYCRLVLAVGPAGSGKTALLHALQGRTETPLVNVNLHISRQLLDLGERSRVVRLPRLLNAVVEAEAHGADTVLLDNTEILFDAGLKQDPLRLLKSLARYRTVVAAWSGIARDGALTYASPGHREYRRYPLSEPTEPLIVNLESEA